jgi:hypothetical protein
MTSKENPEELLSLSQVARKLDISYPKACQLKKTGAFVPDFIGPQLSLFRLARLPELRSIMKEAF